MVVKLAVIITSDSVYRGLKSDEITPIVASDGRFKVTLVRIVPNDPSEIKAAILEASPLSDVILVTGGTGVSPRDITIEVLESIASKRIPGLGEEHRRRSYARVGARALLSRAEGFIVGNTLVFASPGNPDAVRIALDIIAEISEHCFEELRGKGHTR